MVTRKSRRRGKGAAGQSERLGKALGLVSVGLGVASVAAPGRMARMIGLRETKDTRKVLRTIGVRELTSGAGILSGKRPAGWVWSRVGGDAIDLLLLGQALRSKKTNRGRVLLTTSAVAGITALDVIDARRLSRNGRHEGDGEQGEQTVTQAITVNKPREDVYLAWRNFARLPEFMTHLESVEITSPTQSHWRAKGPAGKTVEWDAEITDDTPNERIAWRSLPGADVENGGTVRFKAAPGKRGTEIHLEMRYAPPGGALGSLVATLFGENPEQQTHDDLRRFKQMLETGEVVRSDGTPEGAALSRMVKQRPAQPAAAASGQ